jgi:hypothetical protein
MEYEVNDPNSQQEPEIPPQQELGKNRSRFDYSLQDFQMLRKAIEESSLFPELLLPCLFFVPVCLLFMGQLWG